METILQTIHMERNSNCRVTRLVESLISFQRQSYPLKTYFRSIFDILGWARACVFLLGGARSRTESAVFSGDVSPLMPLQIPLSRNTNIQLHETIPKIVDFALISAQQHHSAENTETQNVGKSNIVKLNI